MTDEKWRVAWDVYKNLLATPADQRQAFLASAGCDSETVEQVLALLEEADSDPNQPPEPVLTTFAFGPGQRIGRYLIEGVLGRGGMSDAYSAYDPDLDRRVALKVLRWVGPEEGADNYVREARAASALNHPNIVTVFEILRQGPVPVIVMELVPGEPLRELCGQPRPRGEVLRVGAQMAEALSAAHAAKVVHGDIKPENVIVRPDGYVKIVDFGLAQRLDGTARSLSGAPAGTMRYMSPEQVQGGGLGSASDVFATGVVLFEMAAGSHPFPAQTAVATMLAISSGQPRCLCEVNPSAGRELSDLIARMLAKTPSARPSAKEVATALQQMQSNQPRLADLAAAPKRRVRWPVVAALSVLLLGMTWRLMRPPAASESALLEALPYTSDPGVETQPAVSPDGDRVAYAAGKSNLDRMIVIRSIQGGIPVRLTSGSQPESYPAWSPDGRWIAFLRSAVRYEADLMVIPAEGGAERRIARLRTQNDGGLAWSLDGAFLVVPTNQAPEEVMALFAIPLDGSPWKRITNPPAASEPFGDSTPAFSPDGRMLAFSREMATGSRDLFVVPLKPGLQVGGEPLRIQSSKPFNTAPAWTPDSREIIFSSGSALERRLYRVTPGRRKPRILEGVGEFGYESAIAHKPGAATAALLYTRVLRSSNIFRLPFDWDARGVPRPRLSGLRKVAATTGENIHPNVSPDGKRIAFVSNRTGSMQVWVADSEAGQETQWTNSNCTSVAVPRWSADGRRITFTAMCNNQTDVFVVDGPGLAPLRLTDSPALDEISAFSPDGRWLYFTSYRDGNQHIWRVPTVGGQAQPFTRQISSNAYVSSDGKTLYFSGRSENGESVWSVPVDGGDAKLLIRNAAYFSVSRGGIFFSPAPRGGSGPFATLTYLDFASRAVYPLTEVPEHSYVFTLPADGSVLYYSASDQASTDLMKVSPFR